MNIYQLEGLTNNDLINSISEFRDYYQESNNLYNHSYLIIDGKLCVSFCIVTGVSTHFDEVDKVISDIYEKIGLEVKTLFDNIYYVELW